MCVSDRARTWEKKMTIATNLRQHHHTAIVSAVLWASIFVFLTGCSAETTSGICGDGVIQTGEACDDANTETDDGCNASCMVEDGFTCEGAPSTCEPEACQPSCEDKSCGPDGCGGVCGICEEPAVCQAGECVQCEPQCGGLECGNDGCGGSCGDCGTGEVCQGGSCIPDGSSACAPNPCLNGGTCNEGADGEAVCTCTEEYIGENCELPVALQNCNGDLESVGNGICENSLNILACLYDGGDCCVSTCPLDYCENATDSTCFDPNACENIPICDLECEDVTCDTPPAPYCSGELVVTFSSNGQCNDGACFYTPTLSACSDETSCVAGACVAVSDACADITCDVTAATSCVDDATLAYPDSNPTCDDGVCGNVIQHKRCPSEVCQDGACVPNAQCSADEGTLGDGTCQPTNNTASCNFDNGDCCPSTCSGACETTADSCLDPHASENDGCANLACDAPQPTCNESQDAIISGTAPQCIQGSCVYLETTEACPDEWLCNNATCVDVTDPCALVTCDSPPSTECLDGDTVRSYASAGECTDGVCEYATTDTDCGELEICTGGICYAIADAFEPDSADAPVVLTSVGDTSRSIDPSDDEDFFEFTIYVDASVTLETSGTSGDTKLYLYNDSGSELAYNDDGGTGFFSRISLTIEPGTYLAKVTNYSTFSSVISSYTLTLSLTPADAFDGCGYIDCSVAPGPSCNEAGEIVTYTGPGECLDNTCFYTEATSSCDEGFICSNGTCLDASDPCAGILCDAPPPTRCTSPTRGVVYGESGTCVEGQCIYESTVNLCGENEGCDQGVCTTCDVAYPTWLGDGFCDGSSYNSAACGWDGGDCCPSTCTGSCSSATEANCEDPFATENAPDLSELYPECTGTVSWIGDGNCDGGTNVATCGWDGGDCCVETNSSCADNTNYPCNCLDPELVGDPTDASDGTDPTDPTATLVFTLDPDVYYLDATWWVETNPEALRVHGPFGFSSEAATETSLELEAGNYCVVIQDAYGDGGTVGNVANGDTTVAAWSGTDYTDSGRFCFTVTLP